MNQLKSLLMESSKYYTPDIEEFHVGFELEAINTASNHPNIYEWVKFKLDLGLGEQWEHIEDYIDKNQIRVKYLDKSDIEELGFTFLKADEETYLVYYIKEDVVLAYMDIPTTQWIEIYTTKTYDPNGSRIVKAIINNKSELKVLLNQLGIS